MDNPTSLQKLSHFFLTKIIVGIIVVGGLVALTEWSGRLLLDKSQLTAEIKNIIIAILDSAVALIAYIFLFKLYERRLIDELSISSFGKYAITGFATGFILQALFIFVIYIAGNYSVERVNPVSFLLPSFTTALSAGFVAEILIRGVIFRLTEEKLGTVIALLILTILFALMHINVNGATSLSVFSTAAQAGFLLSAAYLFTRSLWFTIFLHFAWDFAEPGIFGAINPGNSIQQSLLTIKISGPQILTGGILGPQNSVQALLVCLALGSLFLWFAKRKGNFVKAYWKR